MSKKLLKHFILVTAISFALLFYYSVCLGSQALAYVMGSSNFRMQKDSINTGGTENSTSTSYKIRDTVGEVGTGESQSTSYVMHAGYRQMEEVYIAITAPATIALTPTIGGLAGGAATGNGTWTVKTDAEAGYNLNVRATATPAMQSEDDSFADYTPAGAGTPDYDWGLAGANSEFGFSPYNTAGQINKYKNNDSNCNTGANVTDEQCWYGLTTSNEQIVNRTSRTTTTGDDTKINFQAEVNTSGGFQTAGNYTATVEVTAVSN